MTIGDPGFEEFAEQYSKLCPEHVRFCDGRESDWFLKRIDKQQRRRLRLKYHIKHLGAYMNTKKILQAIGTSIVIGMGLAVLSLVLKTLIWIYTL